MSNSANRPLSRRAFLRLLGGTGAAALLAACRSRLPAPGATRAPQSPVTTPTESSAGARAYLPQISGTGPGATPTGTVTPTASATPAAQAPVSATETPRPTPTPTATPFPPGSPTKLGIFIGRNDPRIRDLLATSNVAIIKTLEYDANFAAELKQRAPNALLIGRLRQPQVNLSDMNDPTAAAQAFVDQLLPIASDSTRQKCFDAWESINEPVATDADQMKRLAEFEAHRTRLLAQAGVRSVVGNFATGHPPIELWQYFQPALEAAIETNGYLGLHEYSAPTMQFGTPQNPLGWGSDPQQEGWLTLRYRKVYREYLEPNKLTLPILITECGIDGMVDNRPGPQGKGWKDFADYWKDLGMGTDAAGNYVEQLAWYDTQLQQDKYVLGAAIFAAAAPSGWETYEILDNTGVESILKQYVSVHPVR